jgi:thiol:disulfide interchange protein
VRQFAIALLAVAAAVAVGAIARAQDTNPFEAKPHYTDGIVGQFDSAPDFGQEPAVITTHIAPAADGRPAVLMINAKIAAGQHTYSITQPKGGPRPTKIDLEPTSNYRQLGSFVAHPEPKSRIETGPIWTGLKIEEHEGEVTWYAPIEITAGVDTKSFEIKGTIHMEVCQTGGYCQPVVEKFTAHMSDKPSIDLPLPADFGKPAAASPQAASGTFQSSNSAVKLSGQLTPATTRPGESVDLVITATLPERGHIYALADRDPSKGTKPVLIAIESASGLIPHRATTDARVKIDNSVPQFGEMKYHEGAVTWKMRLDVPKNAPAGDYPIAGVFGYQMCESGGEGGSTCELPQGIRFSGTLTVGEGPASGTAPLAFAPAQSYSQVAKAAALFADNFDRQAPGRDTTPVPKKEFDAPVMRSADAYDLDKLVLNDADIRGSLSYYIALAFVGGLILNLMPCVLPVIGLKVMSFVEQAGQSRTHAFVLNVWFAAGIISVFLLLGLLAATMGLSWGGQFGSPIFNATIAAVVFAMGLSLLGVWEVPIPGFFGTGTMHAAAEQEGPLGAFLKGAVTTILATPCTAPFMAAAVAWAVTQPTATTLIVFAALGLGMASPYLLVGVYPELLRFLPRPGAWMETFKQLMGFVLMATVIFILSFIEPAAVVPTVTLLLGVGVACWFYSHTPLTAEFAERAKSWATAGVILLLFVGASLMIYRVATAPTDKAWQAFSLERLKQVAVDEGRTVLVDFSAEWCLNCKFLEKTVLHTKPVENAIARSGAVTMYADYTEYPAEITNTIKALRANGVPVIAVFPGDTPYEPIVFRGGYTADGLITALTKASGRTGGKSIAEASPAATARN